MNRKDLKELGKLLRLVKEQEKGNFKGLSNIENPQEILSLIAKYERLFAEIVALDQGLVSAILVKLSRLKVFFLNLFKKKQQILLNSHWDKIREDNSKFIAKMQNQLEDFQHKVSCKNSFIIKK